MENKKKEDVLDVLNTIHLSKNLSHGILQEC